MPGIDLRRPTTLTRNWGDEIIFTRTDVHTGKVLRRTAGTKGGYQIHVKEEHHYLLEGQMRLRSGAADYTIDAGTAWTVPPLTWHQEEALTDCVVIEVSDPTTEDRYALEPDPGALPSMTAADAIEKLRDLARGLRRRAVDCDHLATVIQMDGLCPASR